MQTLWSRSLQARSTCRCPSCQSPLTGVTRRIKTAPARRRLQFGNTITYFYSSIIATAAYADARWKIAKREALDNAISEVKADLKAREEDQQRRLEALLEPAWEEVPHTQTLRKTQTIEDLDFQRVASIRQRKGSNLPAAQLPLAKRQGWPRFPPESLELSHGQKHWDDVVEDSHEQSTNKVTVRNVESSGRALVHDMEPQSPQVAATGSETNVGWEYGHAMVYGPYQADVRKAKEIQAHHNPSAASATDTKDMPLHPAPQDNEAQKSSLIQDETYKLLIGSRDINRGRKAEEVWVEHTAPLLNDRTRMLHETTTAKLVYTLLLLYLDSSGCLRGTWPNVISLAMPNQESVCLSTKHKEELSRKICELEARRKFIVGLRHNPDILKLVAPLPFPNYEQTQMSERKAEANQSAHQNDMLREIFCQKTSPGILFSKLCSTLLAQKSAPNIHSYNLLIILLSHFQLYPAAMAVIDAMFEARLKQNEVTFAAVLNCYHYAKEQRKFWSYVDRMNCEKDVGINCHKLVSQDLRAAHPDHFVESHHTRNVFHRSDPSKANDKLLFMKAAKNMETYEAIIVGWLGIGNLKKAMAEYAGLLRGGFRVSARILEAFLRYSVRIREWEVGVAIWEQLKVIHRPLPVMTYYWMLQLCQLCQKPKDFETVLRDGLQHGVLQKRLTMEDFDLSDSAFKTLLNRSFASRRLEQNVFVPGLKPRNELLLVDESPEQLPNLYLMVAIKYLDLLEAKKEEQGWYHDQDGRAMKATRDIRIYTAKSKSFEIQARKRAMDIRSRLKNSQSIGSKTSLSVDQDITSAHDVLPEVSIPQFTSQQRTEEIRSIIIESAMPLSDTEVQLVPPCLPRRTWRRVQIEHVSNPE